MEPTTEKAGDGFSGARRKRLGFRIAAILIFSALALVLGEIGARIAGPKPSPPICVADPQVFYRGRPGIRSWMKNDEFSHGVKHNREGFRDRDHPLQKPAGTFRILCLGDSFTYGVGADNSETYPAVMEKILNSDGKDRPEIEVVNAGLLGYSTRHQRLALEYLAPRYHPDLVLVAFLPNDITDLAMWDDRLECTWDHYFVRRTDHILGKFLSRIYSSSRLAQLVLSDYVKNRRKETFRKAHPERFQGVYQEGGSFEPVWKLEEQEFVKIRDLARNNNARFVIVFIPQQEFDGPVMDYPEKRISDFCAHESIPFISTLGPLREAAGEPPLYYEEDGHLMPRGYQLVAESIAAGLLRQRLVPEN